MTKCNPRFTNSDISNKTVLHFDGKINEFYFKKKDIFHIYTLLLVKRMEILCHSKKLKMDFFLLQNAMYIAQKHIIMASI